VFSSFNFSYGMKNNEKFIFFMSLLILLCSNTKEGIRRPKKMVDNTLKNNKLNFENSSRTLKSSL